MDHDSEARWRLATACLLERAGALSSLPVLSETYQLVTALLDADLSGLERAAELVSQDPALSLHVLRFAAAHEPGEPLRSIEQTVLALGSAGLTTLLSECEVVRGLGFPGYLDLQELRDHSVNVALLARFYARAAGVDSDIAYMAGLLHDVGILALARHMPATLSHLWRQLRQHPTLHEACVAQELSTPSEWSVALLQGLPIAAPMVPILSSLAEAGPQLDEDRLHPLQAAVRRAHRLCEQQQCAPHWDRIPVDGVPSPPPAQTLDQVWFH